MEVLITVTVVGLILLAGSVSRKFWLSRYRQRSRKTRQQWASRSPEKLSAWEEQFCVLVGRGVNPADALDGMIIKDFSATASHPNTHAMAAKWMKKPKIQEGIEKVQIAREAHHAKAYAQAGLTNPYRASGNYAAPDETPTADLTEEITKPWEGM